VAGEYGYGKIEDLHAALGYGKFSPRQILQKLAPSQVKEELLETKPAPETPRATRIDHGDAVIRVHGGEDLLVYRAKCCNPIRGEAIVGYITRGKGVAVHAVSCSNVQSLLYEVERKIEVDWDRPEAAVGSRGSGPESFPVHLVIHTDDRPGLLNQLTAVLYAENSNIRNLEARTQLDHDRALIEMTIDVRDKKQLEKLVSMMRRISGVRDVERLPA
jgi:GTP pyrophosphokinase